MAHSNCYHVYGLIRLLLWFHYHGYDAFYIYLHVCQHIFELVYNNHDIINRYQCTVRTLGKIVREKSVLPISCVNQSVLPISCVK